VGATVKTTDAPANAPEYLAQAAKTIGRSQSRQKVFKAIYAGKKQSKTVSALMKATGLTRVRVLQEGGKLAANQIVEQEKNDGETAYRKTPFLQHHKNKVIALAGSPAKLAAHPTKWSPRGSGNPTFMTLKIDRTGARVRQITVDDITNFVAVKKVPSNGNLPKSVSETKFKKGIQRILGQDGVFKDWGGEVNDLFTTRLKIGGKRRSVAFGFKGPAMKGKLNPARMGKNGDQIQRLFESPAEVFIVQHWREIEQSVLKQMELLAVAKSVLTRNEVLYGIMDGQDSRRVYDAYKSRF
jgi:hypothetical protein